MRAEQERVAAEDRARDEAKFAALGPDSPLRDYLEYLNGSDPRARLAMEGARHARSRRPMPPPCLGSADRLVDLREYLATQHRGERRLCAGLTTPRCAGTR